MTIDILTEFDGAAPRGAAGMRREGEKLFLFFPNHRSQSAESGETSGDICRFSTRLGWAGPGPVNVEIVVDWQTPAHAVALDCGYRCDDAGDEWRMITGERQGAKVTYRLSLDPGVTQLALYPEYNYGRCGEFVRSLEGRGVDVSVAGHSREGRDIWMLSLPSPHPGAARFVVQTRDHAYETAGSFGVEGIVRFLLSDDAVARYLRGKFHVFILPMTNPDGVFNGLSRLTWERGADLNRVHTVSDPAHEVVKGTLDRVAPDVYMNVHNWTDKFTDGLLANDETVRDKILTHMPADCAHFKRWHAETTAEFCRRKGVSSTPEANKSWKNYCKAQFGAIGVCFEFPWFGLTPEDMRMKVARAFTALALAAIEERGL